MIFVLGLRSIERLPIRQYPFTQNAVVTVATAYTGADPELVSGFITTPLENAISQANGIDYLTSSSTLGLSTIQAYLKLNYNPDEATTEINTKVNSVLNLLPKESQQPSISVAIGQTINSMYIGFYSDILAENKITDYLLRVVQPQLQALEGVQLAEILGGRTFALRAWLDPTKMAALNVTAKDVSGALLENNFISAAGRTDGGMVTVNLVSNTGLHSIEGFKKLTIKSKNGAVVRLEDVANVTLGSQNYNSAVSFDGRKAVYIGIQIAPNANLLNVIEKVRELFPAIQEQLPEGISAKIVYDASSFVNSSIQEVIRSLIEAVLIVTLVIYLFLASARSIVIPVITIPLSLIGAFFLMWILGFSINLLTLLALVLAIGLVVDDAIIVVENVHRHMEEGKSKLEASLLSARELANPIIAIGIVLIAVYIPVGFMGGLTGALFTEFSFTLAGAVAISTIVALTLSPMMCSKMLTLDKKEKSFSGFVDKTFHKMENSYKKMVEGTLENLPVVVVFSIIVLCSNYFLYVHSQSELAPAEDQGILIAASTAAPNANIGQTELYAKQIYKNFSEHSETAHVFQVIGRSGLNSAISGMALKPWDERKKNSKELQPLVQKEVDGNTGLKTAVFQLPPLPGSQGLPVQLVIGTTESYDQLNNVLETILEKVRESRLFVYFDPDLKIDKSQIDITVDREKAALLGVRMSDIGNVLASNLSENYINFFSLDGRSYQVIPQVKREERLNVEQILDYYIKTNNGISIPLSTILTLKKRTVPESINHFQQLNSVTLSGVPMPGLSAGSALEGLEKIVRAHLPQGYNIDYSGESRQYKQEGTSLLVTFFFAIIVIYLTLAALFESFRDPFIVLISVPMSIFGAMIFVNLGIGGATLNIYTQVGLITLIGLISKHGILIVQFANALQERGKSKREAIAEASAIRLRPILMTSASMVLGVIPLITASGAGAESRFNIGLALASGLAIGTLFTLFVVPGMYLLLAHDLSKEKTDYGLY